MAAYVVSAFGIALILFLFWACSRDPIKMENLPYGCVKRYAVIMGDRFNEKTVTYCEPHGTSATNKARWGGYDVDLRA